MVQTPVLFITFVRPDYARQTWNGIKAAQPKKLYFYSSKGRADKEGEVNCNNEIRAYINERDWECDLHTFFRDECVNIYDSLRGAIDWLFENEERGIRKIEYDTEDSYIKNYDKKAKSNVKYEKLSIIVFKTTGKKISALKLLSF